MMIKESRVYVITTIVYLSMTNLLFNFLKHWPMVQRLFTFSQISNMLFFAIFDHKSFTDIYEKTNFDKVFATLHSLFLFFRNSKPEKLCQSFINYWNCHRWRPVVVVVVGIPALSPKLLLLAYSRVVGSSVLSCVCVCWILRLVAGEVLLLLSSTASLQSKLTYTFVHKSQQVIGENRKIFERVWAILISQQVPSLSNWCTFACDQPNGWELH